MINKMRLFAGCLAGLLLSSSLTLPASAQKGQNFFDPSAWHVSDVVDDLSSGRSLGYCVLSRGYGDNVAMTIAENTSGEASIALHFDASHVAVKDAKMVVLDPGAGEQRNLPASPLNDTSFITKIGRDGAFFDALVQTGFLRVGIKDVFYNFDLSDFDAGRSQLGACVSSLEDAAPSLPEDIQDEVIVAEPVMDEVERDVLLENQQAKELIMHQQEIERLNEHIQVLEDRVSQRQEAQGDVEDLSLKLQALSFENDRLKEDYAQVISEFEKNDGVAVSLTELEDEKAALLAKIDTVEAEKKALLLQLEEASAGSDMMEAVSSLQAERDALSEKLASVAEKNETYEAETLALQIEVDGLMIAREQLTAVQAENSSLEEKVSALMSERDSLKLELADMEAGQSAVAENAALAEGDLRGKIQAQDAEIASLAAQLEQANSELVNNKEASAESLAALNAQLEALQLDKDNLEQEVAALEVEKSDLARMAEKAEAVDPELIALRAQSSELMKSLEKAGMIESDLRAEIDDKDVELASLQEKLDLASARLERGGDADSDMIAELRQEKDMLSARVSDLTRQNLEMAEENVSLRELAEIHDSRLKEMQQAMSEQAGDMKALVRRADAADERSRSSDANAGVASSAVSAVTKVVVAPVKVAAKAVEVVSPAAVSAVTSSAVEASQAVPVRAPEIEFAQYEYQNEAQRLEGQLSRQINQANEIVEPEAAPLERVAEIAPVEAPEKAAVVKPVVAATDEVALRVAAAQDVVSEDIPSLESLGSAQQQEAALMASTKAAEMSAPVVQPVQSSIQAEPVSAPIQSEVLKPAESLETILTRAGVEVSSPVQSVSLGADNDALKAYQWGVGGVYGSSERQALSDADAFDERVMAYITRSQDRCSGDFAVEPSGTRDFGQMRVDSYDIACMSDDVQASAALLFYNEGGMFSAVAHEGDVNEMDNLMDIRDRLVRSLSQS